ncbi:MAG: PadR family transcriptional regulator [Defluviitaleaceae bacterium]|nr:PadR family transcriptional regulator [Defluviitaleaceae bacterium]
MSLRHGLLGLLNYEPMTGYELDKEFKESLAHFWQAKPQQIYRELNAMEKNGWLVSERVPQEDRPNRRVYTITDKGKAEFLDWLSSPNEDIQNATRVKSVFFMRLFFAGETSREQAFELLYAYREQCLADIRKMDLAKEQLNQAVSLYDPDKSIYWKLIGIHGEMMRKTRLEWVEKAIAILKNEGENSSTKY